MKCALVGKNIHYSMSPKIYQYLFKKNFISANYDLIDIEFFNVDKFYNLLNDRYEGLNFTQPYKEVIISYKLKMNIDNIVKEINTINTISYKNKTIYAYNTDYYGFLQSLKYLGIDIKNKNVLLLGYGSTGKLIFYCLKNLANNIVIYNRDITKLSNLSNKNYYENYSGDIDILINATSTSLEILLQNANIKSFIKEKNISYIYDINYRFDNTKIKSFIKNQNIKIVNGISMLILQAAMNFNIWFNKKIKVDEKIINNIIKEILK